MQDVRSKRQGRRARAGASAPRHFKRQQLELVIELYLRECYRLESVARVSELASVLGSNRAYLSEVATEVLGKSLGAELRERQLAYAAQLLTETTLRVREIAAKAAFGTERTFFRAFRRVYGESPGSYRVKTNQMSVDIRRTAR